MDESLGAWIYFETNEPIGRSYARNRELIRSIAIRCASQDGDRPTGYDRVTVTVYLYDGQAMRAQGSIQAMRRTLVEPGVPNGTPAVMTTRSPEPAISSRWAVR